jgi:hypothetical protein
MPAGGTQATSAIITGWLAGEATSKRLWPDQQSKLPY